MGRLKKGHIYRAGVFLLALAVIALVLAALAWFMFGHTGDMADDAMISARYARNLAQGDGLRYNLAPDGARPVEGYSNFLWVLVLAGGFYLQILPRLVTAWVGGVSALISYLVVFGWVKRASGSWWRGVAALLVLATSLPFALWAVQGLETVMFAAFVVASIALFKPDKAGPLAYLFAFLACLTRPDGLLLPAALLGGHLLYPQRDYKRIAISAGFFFALPFLAYTGWRVFYFGSLLPNVFYAKTGLGIAGVAVGLDYLGGWIMYYWPTALLFLAGLFGVTRSRKGLYRFFPAVLLCFVYLLFIVAAGGDFMPDHRFVMHVLPVMVGLGIIGLSSGEANTKDGRWSFLLITLTVIAVSWNAGTAWRYDSTLSFRKNWHEDQASWYGGASSWLLRHSAPSDTIACGDIGYIGFVTDVDRILDTNGLVDPYLASLPGAAGLSTDPHYVLELEPDFMVVMVHYFSGGEVIGHSGFDRAVFETSLLHEEYVKAVEVPGWKTRQRSRQDGKVRESRVRFRIYRRNTATPTR